MSRDNRNIRKEKLQAKNIEYPIIYSYIYEREAEDINRLADKFRGKKIKKIPQERINRTITGYRIEGGKAVPIYKEHTVKMASAAANRVIKSSVKGSTARSRKSPKK